MPLLIFSLPGPAPEVWWTVGTLAAQAPEDLDTLWAALDDDIASCHDIAVIHRNEALTYYPDSGSMATDNSPLPPQPFAELIPRPLTPPDPKPFDGLLAWATPNSRRLCAVAVGEARVVNLNDSPSGAQRWLLLTPDSDHACSVEARLLTIEPAELEAQLTRT